MVGESVTPRAIRGELDSGDAFGATDVEERDAAPEEALRFGLRAWQISQQNSFG